MSVTADFFKLVLGDNSNAPKLNIDDFRSEILRDGIIHTNHFLVRMTLPRVFGTSQTQESKQLSQIFNNVINNQIERFKRIFDVNANTEEDKFFTMADMRKITLRCENVTLPDVNLATVESQRYGYGSTDMVAYAPVYSDLNLGFTVDAKGRIYRLFYEWLNQIVRFGVNTADGVHEFDYNTADERQFGSASPRIDSRPTYAVAYKKDIQCSVEIFVFDTNRRPIFVARLFGVYPRLLYADQLDWNSQNQLLRLRVPMIFKDFQIVQLADRGLFGLYERIKEFDVTNILDDVKNDITTGVLKGIRDQF